MNIRQAILKAADHIEANPQEFDFDSICIPDGHGCGTPACALGWMGFFTQAKPHHGLDDVARDLLGVSAACFYLRMGEFSEDWCNDAQFCASTLRLYADRYHPEELPTIASELARISALPSSQLQAVDLLK